MGTAGYQYAESSPLLKRDPLGSYVIYPTARYPKLIRKGLVKLVSELLGNTGPCKSCTDYFQGQPNQIMKNINDVLNEGTPPTIITGQCAGHNPNACTRPGVWGRITIDEDFLSKVPSACEIATNILHEMGHLARQDRTNEHDSPGWKEFTKKCRTSCLRL